jgi:YesN/AraC family two-component response regulator
LQVYRPTVAIIDLGLPDGSGADLIAELAQNQPRGELVLAMSGDTFNEEVAIAAGADGFLEKPLSSLADFQQAILSGLPAERQPPGPRQMPDERIHPDPIAYRDDMAHLADVLNDHASEKVVDYVAQFTSGVARSANDTPLLDAALALAKARASGRPSQASLARLAGIVQDRLSEKVAI